MTRRAPLIGLHNERAIFGRGSLAGRSPMIRFFIGGAAGPLARPSAQSGHALSASATDTPHCSIARELLVGERPTAG